MNPEPFEIATDPARGLVRVTMAGQWDVNTVEAYRRAIFIALNGLLGSGHSYGAIVALVDVRGGGPQSQEVITAYKERLNAPALSPRKLATVVSSTLLKRQAQRIAIPNQRFFDNEAEAMAWLFERADR